jgi:hypothetical protein
MNLGGDANVVHRALRRPAKNQYAWRKPRNALSDLLQRSNFGDLDAAPAQARRDPAASIAVRVGDKNKFSRHLPPFATHPCAARSVNPDKYA